MRARCRNGTQRPLYVFWKNDVALFHILWHMCSRVVGFLRILFTVDFDYIQYSCIIDKTNTMFLVHHSAKSAPTFRHRTRNVGLCLRPVERKICNWLPLLLLLLLIMRQGPRRRSARSVIIILRRHAIAIINRFMAIVQTGRTITRTRSR